MRKIVLAISFILLGLQVTELHGLNLENELVKYLGGEIKFTIDHYGIDLITAAAEDTTNSAGYIGSRTLTPGSGDQWVFKKMELLDDIEKGNNLIITKTLRGSASYIIAGNDVARVIKQLGKDHFTPSGSIDQPTGPHMIGKLDGRPVVQDPFLANTNRYYLGFKGQGVIHAGLVYAPYIPLVASPTLLTSDFQNQKGFLSSAGFHVVNKGLYCYGAITL